LAPRDFERAVRLVPPRRSGVRATTSAHGGRILISDDAGYITAQTIHVDGGMGVNR
jgi:NAD(P)-dependent dehydrogenase (short-subunit alcohol dehydrogenase family)